MPPWNAGVKLPRQSGEAGQAATRRLYWTLGACIPGRSPQHRGLGMDFPLALTEAVLCEFAAFPLAPNLEILGHISGADLTPRRCRGSAACERRLFQIALPYLKDRFTLIMLAAPLRK